MDSAHRFTITMASMVAAITSLGPVGEFNVEWDSPAALAMLDSSSKLVPTAWDTAALPDVSLVPPPGIEPRA